jgi:hypothetical protein
VIFASLGGTLEDKWDSGQRTPTSLPIVQLEQKILRDGKLHIFGLRSSTRSLKDRAHARRQFLVSTLPRCQCVPTPVAFHPFFP